MTQQKSDLPIELARPAQRTLYEAGYLLATGSKTPVTA